MPAVVDCSMRAGEADQPFTLHKLIGYDGARITLRREMRYSSELTGLSRLLQHLCIPYMSA
jgi:hypothetical protein